MNSTIEKISLGWDQFRHGVAARYARLQTDIESGKQVDVEGAIQLLKDAEIDPASLTGDLAIRERMRDLQTVVATKGDRQAALEAAGRAKSAVIDRHFVERKKLADRQRIERAGAVAEVDQTRHALDEIADAERELQDIRRCYPHGPATVAQQHEIAEANILRGSIIQVQNSVAKIEIWTEESTIAVVPFSMSQISPAELQPGQAIGYELVLASGSGWRPRITSIIAPPTPAVAPLQEPEAKPPTEGTIIRVRPDLGIVTVQLDGLPTHFNAYRAARGLPFRNITEGLIGKRVECQESGFLEVKILRLIDAEPNQAAVEDAVAV